MTNKSQLKTWIGIIVLVFANTTAAGAEWCSAALTTISNNFPDTPYWVITLINNIPNLCAVFMTLLAGLMVNRKIGLKQMMLFGICFHAIGGFLPVLVSNSIYIVLLARLIFGIGYGIMQGICISMSFKLITDTRLREHAIGWCVAAQYGMNMIAQIAVGYLAGIQWNFCFYIYLWSVIPFFVVLFLCPKFPLDKDDRSAIGGDESRTEETLGESLKALPSVVWIFSIIIAISMMCSCSAIFLNLGPIIQGRLGYDPSMIGFAMTFYSVATIVSGLCFGTVTKTLKHWTLFISLLVNSIGVLIFTYASGYSMVCAALVIAGLGGTWSIPAAQAVYSKYIPKHRSFIASSISMACVNIGAFLSTPYIAVFEGFGYDSTATLVPSAVIMILVGLISVKFWKDAQKLPVVN